MPNKTNFNRALDRMVEKKAQEHKSTIPARDQFTTQNMSTQAFYDRQARKFQPIIDAINLSSQNQGK